ncbi:hypothetical protein HDU80_008270 [Chytriomyces hyalinus]|nr:hypothetical protein HDU80_008270 [Chytriomyces hyalinus]
MRNFTSIDIAAISIHGVLTATGFFELAYLVYFVTVIERRINKEISRTFSWFNITLFILSMSLISLHASTAVCVFEQPNPFDAKIPVTIANLSYCICELIKLAGGVRYKIAAGVVAISPWLYTAQFIIICLHLYWSDEALKPVTMLSIFISASLGGVSIIAFDCVMLVTFMTFLQENQIERSHSQTFVSVQPTERFSIIASYGRWSCCMLLGALVFYLALAVVGYGSTYGNVLEALCYAMMDVIILLLAGMKMALHLCDAKEEQADSLLRHGGSKGSVGRGEFTSVSGARSDGNVNVGKGEVGVVRSSEVKAKTSLKYEARPVR